MRRADDELAVRKHLKVFIGALPPGVTERDVGNHFGRYGHVLNVTLIQGDRDGQKSPYAFATYKFAADADCAVVDPQRFPGAQRPLNMGFAAPKGDKKRNDDFQDGDPCKVFVGGITDRDSEEQIGDFFSQWGLVILVYRDRQWGFVAFSTKEAATRLLDEGSVIFQRRRLDIKASDSKKQMDEGERQELLKRAIARHFHKKQTASAAPPQGYPPQGYPPPGYYGQPPPGYPPQGYPPGGPPGGPHGAPPGYYPPQGSPPPGYPPSGYPPQGQAPPGYPPQPHDPYAAPPSGGPPHGGPYYPPPQDHYGGPPGGGPPPSGEPMRALPPPDYRHTPPGNDPHARPHGGHDPYASGHSSASAPHGYPPPGGPPHPGGPDYYRDSRHDRRDERPDGGGYYREQDSYGAAPRAYPSSSDPYGHPPSPQGHPPSHDRYRPYG